MSRESDNQQALWLLLILAIASSVGQASMMSRIGRLETRVIELEQARMSSNESK